MASPAKASAAPPPQSESGEEGNDPRAELVRRLLEYEQIKRGAAKLDALPQIGIPSLHRRIRQRPGTGGAAPPQNRVVAVVEGRRGQGLTPLSRIAAARLEAPVRNEERFAEIRAEAEHRALVVDEIGKVGPPFAVRDRRVRNESHEHTEPSPCR